MKLATLMIPAISFIAGYFTPDIYRWLKDRRIKKDFIRYISGM